MNKWIFVVITVLSIPYKLLSQDLKVIDTAGSSHRNELLYNGIVLPATWPPNNIDRSRNPVDIPYLKNKPAVIPIDVGRQLFVDDFLTDQTNLKTIYHVAEKIAGNPLFKPETEIEMNGGECPVAAPFNDGLWYDAKDDLYKLWYHAGWFSGTGYATSTDGIHWNRPVLDIEPGANLILKPRNGFKRDGATIYGWTMPLKARKAALKCFCTTGFRGERVGKHMNRRMAFTGIT